MNETLKNAQRTLRRAAQLLAMTLVLLPSSPLRAQEQYAGANIASIEFRADTTFDTSKLGEMIDVAPGEPLSIRELQNSIKILHATGDFQDIRVEAERLGLDVRLTFILSIHYRIDEITFEGYSGDLDLLRRELQVRAGDVLSLSAVDRSAVAIQTLLNRRGFLEATVDPEVQFFRDRNRALVTFHVTTGLQAVISRVEFEGDLAPFTAKQLIAQMNRKPGSAFRSAEARRDAERIRSFLLGKDRRTAEVRFLGEEYDQASHSVVVRYRILVGPVVRVEVEGVSRKSVRRWIPFRRGDDYSPDVMERSTSRILEEYQRRGYFFAAVDVDERNPSPNELVLVFKIEPGRRYEVDDILFEGNAVLSDRRLREVVTAGPVGGLRSVLGGLLRRSFGVTHEQLSDDRDALETLYTLEGFTQARIGQPDARTSPDGKLDIVFPIVEGPRTMVSEVVIEGSEQVPASDLPKLGLKAGDPLNPQVVATDVVALKSFYGNRGHVEVQVSPHPTISEDRTSARIAYRIVEGPRVTVGDVVVRGNTYTRSRLIERKASLEEGDPFSYRDILTAQRNLYRLGIFQRVDVSPERSGTSIGERNILIDVEEGRNLTVAGSVGYSDEAGAGGSVSVSHRNLFGTGRYAGVDVRISQNEQRYLVSYREPYVLNFDVPVQVTAFRSRELQEAAGNAEFTRVGSFIEAERIIRERARWSLRYEYRIVDCVSGVLCDAATGEIPIEGIPREEQEISISSLTPTFFWDRRDDALDPHRGMFASSSLEYAFPVLNAKAEFLKGFAQTSWYWPLSVRSVLAVSGRVGLIEPQGPTGGDTALVPISERFFAGGESTHRAFDLDTLGIIGETLVRREGDVLPIGGNAMALLNAEYRFPLFGTLGGTVFVDTGNVWREIGDLDVGEMRIGAGAGLRYLTPVGPIRFDAGWKLDREPGEDAYALFLTLGFPF